MTKFYELFLSSFKNNPEISISRKLNNNKITLTMSVKLIDDSSYTVDYTIVLEKIPKSNIVRLEENMMDMHQIKQKLINKKWIDINEDDVNYYFGFDKTHIFDDLSSKIKIKYRISYTSSRYHTCKIWTKNYVIFNDQYHYDNEYCYEDPRLYYSEDTGIIINKIDTHNDNRIFMELKKCTVNFY